MANQAPGPAAGCQATEAFQRSRGVSSNLCPSATVRPLSGSMKEKWTYRAS